MGEILKKFGKRVRFLRRTKDMTQERLAELAKLSLQSVGEIERGRGNTTLTNVENLANALEVSLPSLFDFGDVDMTRQDAQKEIESLLAQSSDNDVRAMLSVARALSRK